MSQRDPAAPSAASVMATSSGEAKGKRPATPLPLVTVPPAKKPKTGDTVPQEQVQMQSSSLKVKRSPATSSADDRKRVRFSTPQEKAELLTPPSSAVAPTTPAGVPVLKDATREVKINRTQLQRQLRSKVQELASTQTKEMQLQKEVHKLHTSLSAMDQLRFQAVKKCLPSIKKQVSASTDLQWFGNSLVVKELIGAQPKDYILHAVGVSDVRKVGQLMQSVIAQIENNPVKYGRFIAVLRQEPALASLAERIKAEEKALRSQPTEGQTGRQLSTARPQLGPSDKPRTLRRKCGECPGCLTKSDCQECTHCKDMVKYGGPGELRRACIHRQCEGLAKVRDQPHPPTNKDNHAQARTGSPEGMPALTAIGSGSTTKSHRKEEEQMDEESRQIFDDALQDGWVKTQMTKVLVTGIAGSGKTSSKHVLFEEEQPEVRQSTPLTAKPIRATRVDKKSSKWIRVGTKKMLKLLAIAMRYYASIRPKEIRSNLEREATSSSTSSPTSQVDPTSKSQGTPTSDTNVPPTTQPAAASEELESTSQTEVELLDLLKEIQPSEMVHQMDFVQFIDSGGQPQFLEIMPALLTGDLFCIFVIKLCEKLDEYPMVECYNEKGELVGEPYSAALTNEEFLKQGITTMLSQESQAGKGSRQRILIIGTHKDREGECLDKETTEDKNEKLREVLLPYTDDIIYYGNDLKHLIFPLNARSPAEEDHTVAEKIRNVIAQCSPEPVRIPIRWYCFELRVKELAEDEGRSVLSTEECFSVARRLHFDEKSFVAALEFLHKLSSISYFRQFLKGVVFSDPQVLVDIVSEIVEALHELAQGTSSEGQKAFEGDWRKMRDYGIVTIERLKSFKRHHVPGLFTHKEVIELFKALLILAGFDESSYFMPCLLQRLHATEVANHRVPASSNVAPLLIRFPQGPRCGVFCSLVVCLLSSDNQSPGPWQLTKTAENAPRCLYRNCIEFVIPGYPATITLIDSFTSFEVHVHIRPELCEEFCSELCPLVRDALLDGLEKATQTLHYSNWEAKLAFFCPCNEGAPHRADLTTYKVGRWSCSNDPVQCGRLEDKHMLWISSGPPPQPCPVGGAYSQSSAQCPTLKELDQLEFTDWYGVGLQLGVEQGTLDEIDDDRSRVRIREKRRAMFQAWLRESPSASYADLARALYLAKEESLAHQLCQRHGIPVESLQPDEA